MKVSDFDFSNFYEYVRRYAGDADSFSDLAPVEVLLHYWQQGKNKFLWDLMGHELIKSHRFTYKASDADILQQIDTLMTTWDSFCSQFSRNLFEYFGVQNYYHRASTNTEDSKRYIFCTNVINYGLYNSDALMSTRFSTRAVCSCVHPQTGKKYSICGGQKIMKLLGELAREFQMTEEFEKFRIAHSQVLNTKVITGELVLSIHPLDYATASDNENGWNSCMSWKDEGCYRLGTVEMMNSPMVICAYVKSDTQEMDHPTWPSKKWRAWIIVDDVNHCIYCNKHYPYQSEPIARNAVNWVAHLANEHLGWHVGEATLMEEAPEHYYLRYTTDFMYNDFNYQNNVYASEDPLPLAKGKYKYINYSGSANCMHCGRLITYDGNSDDAGTLFCATCGGDIFCASCGCRMRHDDSETYWGPDDQPYCESCYNENFSTCENCDEVVHNDEIYYVSFNLRRPEILQKEEELGLASTHWSSCVDRTVCSHCLQGDFGVTHIIEFTRSIDGVYYDMIPDVSEMSDDQFEDMFSWNSYFHHPNYKTLHTFLVWLRQFFIQFCEDHSDAIHRFPID